MTRRVYLYFTVTFILGAALGGLGVYYFFWATGRIAHRSFNKDRALSHLKKELNLSATQVQQLSQIFDDGAQKIKEIQKQMDPQLQALRQENRNRIREILNPDQVKKFDELVRQIDERRRRRQASSPPSH
jgi:Spy/CpxP family protein refolding chaperone